MAEKQFKPTESQRQAIEAPIMDLLVSAAAGSGKTAVLSRRILRLVSEGDDPVSLSRMLVVTFTKAAAEELKLRIGRELKKALAETQAESGEDVTGKERNLTEAIKAIESAEISTIHSFCFSLIKKNFSSLGLSAALRIGDDAETRLLKIQTMEETIDRLYEDDVRFSVFAENLIELKDSRLSETLLDFYDKLIALPEGVDSLLSSAECLTKSADSFESTRYHAVIHKTVDDFFAYYTALYQTILPILSADPTAEKVYLPMFQSDLEYLLRYRDRADCEFFTLCESLATYHFEKLGSYRGEKSHEILWAVSVRNEMKEALSKLSETLFFYSHEEYARDAADTAAFSLEMHHVLTVFDEAYAKVKATYGILDFADLERFAYRLLVQDGRPTALAETVSARYDAVFIDEYQDTNDLQDAIFSAISRQNRFMVGDIKQSIYSFRGAVPELFSHYRDSFPVYQEGSGQKAATIFLSENFRCDSDVVTFSNAVFEKLFHNNSGRVPYLDKDALVFGKSLEQDAALSTQLMLVNRENMSEYRAVAEEILKKVREGVKPKDIVILLRSMTNAEHYREALEELSLTGQCGKGDDTLFAHPEVLLLISLLNVIDNPTRDIYLAAVLKSPLFGVTLGELALIREEFPALTLYASLLLYREEKREENAVMEKLGRFFAFLEKARRYAEMQSSDRVIRYLFSVTPLRAVSVKYCGNCQALMAFYDYARAYEAESFRGVHALCTLVREVDGGDEKEKPKFSPHVDLAGIRIMTIHASKGCEFDYVFLADTAKGFNAQDESRSLVYDKSLGIGLRLRQSGGFVRYDTLIRRAISFAMRENRYDEEMRILYVALTRAKKQLVISAEVKTQKAEDEFFSRFEMPQYEHPYLYTHLASFRDMMAYACRDRVWEKAMPNKTLHTDTVTAVSDRILPLPDFLTERIRYRYPHEMLLTLPTKLSVSRLYPTILDDTAEVLVRSEQANFDKVPLFMQDKSEATAAERGTATHLFMQFCDFEEVLANGVDHEIGRLTEKRFITSAIAELIDRKKLYGFFKSALFKRMKEAEILLREERFNVRMPAVTFTEDSEKKALFADETVLVQGVVDCMLFEKDDAIVLIDYKTDRLPKDRNEAERILRERYTLQLFYYRMAVEEIYQKRVKEMLLYSFALADTVVIL